MVKIRKGITDIGVSSLAALIISVIGFAYSSYQASISNVQVNKSESYQEQLNSLNEVINNIDSLKTFVTEQKIKLKNSELVT